MRMSCRTAAPNAPSRNRLERAARRRNAAAALEPSRGVPAGVPVGVPRGVPPLDVWEAVAARAAHPGRLIAPRAVRALASAAAATIAGTSELRGTACAAAAALPRRVMYSMSHCGAPVAASATTTVHC